MSDSNFPQAITHLVEALSASGNYEALVQILSLLCLFSISNRPVPSSSIASAAPENPLQRLLGDLGKGGGTPDMLSSLLPLLANPQLKSKLNPANLSSIMGMINSLAGGLKPPMMPKAANGLAPSNAPAVQTTVQTTPPPKKSGDTPASVQESETTAPSGVKNDAKTEALPTPSEKPPVSAPTAAPPAETENKKEPTPPVRPANRYLNWKTNF